APFTHRFIEAADSLDERPPEERGAVDDVTVEQRRQIAPDRRPGEGPIAKSLNPMTYERELRIRIEERRGALEPCGAQPVVGIQRTDVLACRVRDAQVSRRRETAVRRAYDRYPRPPGEGGDSILGALIGRAVIDDDDVEVVVGLLEHARDGIVDE